MASSIICVEPASSLVDDKLSIVVSKLKPKQTVTLEARIVGDRGEVFESHAQYIADKDGEVDVRRDSSLGGSYSGVEPMGLIWSMKQAPGQKKGLLLRKSDVTKPYNAEVKCFDGHVTPRQTPRKPLSSATFQRWYMADGVKRIPVREGRIRGTLFIPPGAGPFPGVIDMLGGAGGLVEFKASLLASRGFAALALAYMAYDDLPMSPQFIDLEYFEEAANWLSRHHKVLPHGIGVHANCFGSWIALLMASFQMKAIKTVVAISPITVAFGICFSHKGKMSLAIPLDNNKKVTIAEGEISRFCYPATTSYYTPVSKYSPITAVENISCPVLLVYGTDDLNVNPDFSVACIRDGLKKHGKESLCSVLCYPNAGHIIEPPYTPHFYASFAANLGKWTGDYYTVYGGEMKCHARAQEESWPKILTFLQKNLEIANSKL